MSIYQKKISVGKFAKLNQDFQDGNTLFLLDEGKEIEGTFGMQDVFKIKLPNGEESNLSINQTSINRMIDKYGEDSKNWVNKPMTVHAITQNVQGKFKKVVYIIPEGMSLEDEGGSELKDEEAIDVDDRY